MEYKIAKSKIQILSQRLHYMLFISVGLLILNISLVGLVAWSVMHQKRTIVPVSITQGFTVSDYVVDSNYLRQMALFFVAERMNLSPASITQAHAIILQNTDPDFYHEFIAILTEEAKEIVKQNISSVFYPTDIHVNTHNLSVLVKGSLSRWVGSLALEPIKKSYLLTFTYHAGCLKISSFVESASHNP